MEDGWVLLVDVARQHGITAAKARERVRKRHIDSKTFTTTVTITQHVQAVRVTDVPAVLRPPDQFPPEPHGTVYLISLSKKHRVSVGCLRHRAKRRGIKRWRVGQYTVVPLADVPALLKRVPNGPVPQRPQPPPALEPLVDINVSDGGDRVVRVIASMFNVTAESIYDQDRRKAVVEARHLCIAALHRLGLSPTEVARHIGRCHSTVAHSLDKTNKSTELARRVEDILGNMPTNDPRLDLDTRLDIALQDTRMSVIAAIRSYLRGTLLGWEKHDPMQMASGLAHLAADDGVRKAVATVLTRLDLGQHIGRMDAHIVASGYRRAAS